MEDEIQNDQELYSYFRGRNAMLCKENFMFLMTHPEVKRLLNDYLSNILLHKPDDVFKHTKDYFKILSDKGQSETFVILVGPSSVGKSTLITRLLSAFEDKPAFEQPKFTSTKEKDNCYHVTKEAFIDLMNKNEIITYTYDNKEKEYEGLTKGEVERIKTSGKICLMEIDLVGAKKINNSCVGGNFIGILPPSLDALRVRIKEHVKTNTANINKMLDKANDEIKEIETYTFISYRIMNDKIETGYKDFENCIFSLFPYLKYGNEKIAIDINMDLIKGKSDIDPELLDSDDEKEKIKENEKEEVYTPQQTDKIEEETHKKLEEDQKKLEIQIEDQQSENYFNQQQSPQKEEKEDLEDQQHQQSNQFNEKQYQEKSENVNVQEEEQQQQQQQSESFNENEDQDPIIEDEK